MAHLARLTVLCLELRVLRDCGNQPSFCVAVRQKFCTFVIGNVLLPIMSRMTLFSATSRSFVCRSYIVVLPFAWDIEMDSVGFYQMCHPPGSGCRHLHCDAATALPSAANGLRRRSHWNQNRLTSNREQSGECITTDMIGDEAMEMVQRMFETINTVCFSKCL